jgi:hypothetical protein
MQAGGTLLLAAELERIRTLGPGRVECIYPTNEIVAQVLEHVGIFDLLEHPRRPRVTHPTVRYWKVNSGTSAEGERAANAIEDYAVRFSDPNKQALYRALTEAMTNCRHHAYPDTEDDRRAGHWWTGPGAERARNWWMFSQLMNDQLTVGLCDLGIGIPRSLRRDEAGLLRTILNVITGRGLVPNDVQLISAAMAIGESRTKEQHRGKGLLDMRKVLDGLDGVLHIHSGRGYYRYTASRAGEKCTNFKKPMAIRGTLVLWQIPLAGAVSA